MKDAAKAKHFQDRMSHLFYNKLHPLLDKILTDFFPEGVEVKLDKLELDLGTITEANLEKSIEAAIKKQLPIILAESALLPQKKWIHKTKQRSDFELLDFYLKTGYFPWWQKNTKGFKADLWVQQLLKKDSLLARKILGQHLNSPQARQRLDYQLSDNTLQEVKTVMMGGQKLDYDWYLDQLIQLHQHVKIRATTKKNYRKYIDDLLLSYLGQSGQMETSPQDFGRYFLENVAQKYHLSPDEVYDFYQARLPKKGINKAQKNWLSVLDNWMQDEFQQKGRHRLSTVELIMTYLQKGILPNQQNQPMALADLEELIIELSKEGHVIWIGSIKKAMDSPNVLKRISEQFNAATKEALLQLLYGGRLYRLIKTIQEEILLLLQIKKAPAALEKKLLFFYQNALVYFYTDFQEHTDFSKHFIVFLKDYLEKAVPLDWTKWWERLSEKQQHFISSSSLLVRFFSIAESQKIFTGNLKLSNTQLVEKLEQIPVFVQFLKKYEKAIFQSEAAKNNPNQSKNQLKSILMEWSKAPEFYQKVAAQLSLVEIANIARIIMGKEAKAYEQKFELVRQIIQEKPLPRKQTQSGLSDVKILWLGLIKAKHQQKYHGNRGKRFWHAWIGGLSLLLDTSEEKLWQHFQQLPQKGIEHFTGMGEDSVIIEKRETKQIVTAVDEKTIKPIHLVQFLDTGQLPLGLNLAQLEEQLQNLIRAKDPTIKAIFQAQIARTNKSRYFRKFASNTIQLIEQVYFTSFKKSLQKYFADFSAIVKLSAVLPVLSMISLKRDIRLALLYSLAKTGQKLPSSKALAVDVLQVISQFYSVTYHTLLMDLAKVVQRQRPKLKTELVAFFQAIDIPKPVFSKEQTFFYFLKTGTFPAGSPFQKVADIETWLAQSDPSFSAIFKVNLTRSLSELPQFKRFITQFSTKRVVQFNQLLATSHWEDLMKMVEQFKVFFRQQPLPEKVKLQLEQATHTGLLHFLVQNPAPPFNPNTLFQAFGRHLYFLIDLNLNEELEALNELVNTGKERERLSLSNLDIAEQLLAEDKQQGTTSENTAISEMENSEFRAIDLSEDLQQLLPNWETVHQPIWAQLLTLLMKIPAIKATKTQLVNAIKKELNQLIETETNQSISYYIKVVLEKISRKQGIPLLELYQKIENLLEKKVSLTLAAKALKTHLSILKTESIEKEKSKEVLGVDEVINQPENFKNEQKVVLSLPIKAKLAGIISFLNTGSFTKASSLQAPAQVETALLLLLEKEPKELFLQLKELKYLPKAIERMSYHFSETTLQKMVIAFDAFLPVKMNTVLIYWEKIDWHTFPKNFGLRIPNNKTIFIAALTLGLKGTKSQEAPIILFKKLLQFLLPKETQQAVEIKDMVLIQLQERSKNTNFQQLIKKIAKEQEGEREALIVQTLNKDLKQHQSIYYKNYQAKELGEVIDFYVSHTTMPWWYTEEKELGTVILKYAKKEERNLRQQFQKIWTNKAARANILKAVSEKQLLALTKVFYQQYTLIVQATLDLVDLAVQTVQLSDTNVANLKNLKWTPILEYFWQNPTFSSETFVVQTLEKVLQLAGKPLKKWQPILLFIAEEQVRLGDVSFGRLKDILYKWQHEPKKLNILSIPSVNITKRPLTKNQKEKSTLKSTATLAPKGITSQQQQTLETLQDIQHFLAFGAIRHKTAFPNKKAFVTKMTECLNKTPKLLKALLANLLADQPAVFRLLATLPTTLIWRIIQLLYGAKMTQIDAYRLDLMYLLPGIVRRFNRAKMDGFFQYQLLAYFSTANKGLFKVADFYSHILQRLAKQEDKNALTILHQIKEQIEQGQIGLRGNWEKLIPLLYKRLKDQLEKGQQRIKWSLEGKNKDMKDEILYVNNAGISVIAPFLPRYFKMLKMTNESGQFIDEPTACRAVHLIQYIATGQSETEEPLLVFNKLLCGLPVATPVPKGIELTPQEIETTKGMMSAILAHWKGIGTATIDGLRGGFLIRDGRIEWHSDGYWNLDVEKKAYDVIMRTLPWSISMVQFPWMKYRIQVTWY